MEYLKFKDQKEANGFIQSINKDKGIPKNVNAVTRTWTTPVKIKGEWYVPVDEVVGLYKAGKTVVSLTKEQLDAPTDLFTQIGKI